VCYCYNSGARGTWSPSAFVVPLAVCIAHHHNSPSSLQVSHIPPFLNTHLPCQHHPPCLSVMALHLERRQPGPPEGYVHRWLASPTAPGALHLISRQDHAVAGHTRQPLSAFSVTPGLGLFDAEDLSSASMTGYCALGRSSSYTPSSIPSPVSFSIHTAPDTNMPVPLNLFSHHYPDAVTIRFRFRF
jgi:hypothetical protein